jgi:hypothetical protein
MPTEVTADTPENHPVGFQQTRMMFGPVKHAFGTLSLTTQLTQDNLVNVTGLKHNHATVTSEPQPPPEDHNHDKAPMYHLPHKMMTEHHQIHPTTTGPQSLMQLYLRC